MGPPAFSAVADVIDNQGTFVHAPRNLGRGILVPLTAWGVGLDIGIGIDLDHVVFIVVGANGVAVLLAVFHVSVAVLIVAILVV